MSAEAKLGGRGAGVRGVIRDRPEPLALALVVVGVVILMIGSGHGSAVPGILLLGLSTGAGLAIQGIGMILVYRSNRVLNFSQVALGALSGLLFYVLWVNGVFIRGWGAVCGCVPADLHYAAFPLVIANFVLSMLAGLLLAPLLGALVYIVLVRPLEKAPPLVLTMLTVAVAYLVNTIASFAYTQVKDFFDPTQGKGTFIPPLVRLPFDISLRVGTVVLDLPLLLGIVLALGLAVVVGVFLRGTSMGMVVRATADDSGRARTLGVSVLSVRAMVWAVAATLSAVAAMLAAAHTAPAYLSGDIGTTLLVQLLAVVTIARMRSIPVALAAAVTLGIVQEGLATALQSQTVYLTILLPLLAGFLFLQRPSASRAEHDLASAWPAADEVRPIPPEMLRLPTVRRWLIGGGMIGVLVLGVLPWLLAPGQVTLASQSVILAMVALSILVLSGWAGQISLGQLAIAAVGAYITSVLAGVHGVPWPLAILAGAILGCVAACVVGFPALRLPGLHLAVITLALSLTVTGVLLSPDQLGQFLPGTLTRPKVFGLDTAQEQVFYYFSLGVLGIVVATVLRLRRGRTARALVACRDNERAAQSFGINLVRARLAAFAVSGLLAGLAGGLYAFAQNGAQSTAYGVPASLTIFLATLVGGLGSPWGPLIGMAFWLLTQLAFPDYAGFAVGGGVVLLFMLYPGGVGGAIFAVRDALLRRIAVRHNIWVPSLMGESDEVGATRRARIAPKLRRGTASPEFVRAEYRAPSQWSLPPGAILEDRRG